MGRVRTGHGWKLPAIGSICLPRYHLETPILPDAVGTRLRTRREPSHGVTRSSEAQVAENHFFQRNWLEPRHRIKRSEWSGRSRESPNHRGSVSRQASRSFASREATVIFESRRCSKPVKKSTQNLRSWTSTPIRGGVANLDRTH